MKHALGIATVVAMVACISLFRVLPRTSFDRTLLLVGTWFQAALLVSLYAPISVALKEHLASLSHLGFVTSLVYGTIAGNRPTLMLCMTMLCLTMVTRIVTQGCLFSLAEDPSSKEVKKRASWNSDWQLMCVVCIGLLRLIIRWEFKPTAQAACAFASCLGAAYSWS